MNESTPEIHAPRGREAIGSTIRPPLVCLRPYNHPSYPQARRSWGYEVATSTAACQPCAIQLDKMRCPYLWSLRKGRRTRSLITILPNPFHRSLQRKSAFGIEGTSKKQGCSAALGINTGFSTPVFRLTRQGKDNSFSRDGLRRGSPCFWPRSITDNSRQIAFVITTQMILGGHNLIGSDQSFRS